jgi:hypothetical protein
MAGERRLVRELALAWRQRAICAPLEAILDANPGVTFDPLTVSGLAARQIRIEAMAFFLF